MYYVHQKHVAFIYQAYFFLFGTHVTISNFSDCESRVKHLFWAYLPIFTNYFVLFGSQENSSNNPNVEEKPLERPGKWFY